MKTDKIEKLFCLLGSTQVKFRWWFIAAIILFTAVGFAGLPKLKLEDNTDSWLDDADQTKKDMNRFKDKFGNDSSILVLVEADDVFTPEVLDAIQRLGTRLENEVPFANKVTSLTSLSISTGTEDGFEINNPFGDGIPSDSALLAQKKKFIMSRESLVNNLVSDDAKETWVMLSLEPFKDDRTDLYAIGNAVDSITSDGEFKSSAYKIHVAGYPYTETMENRVISKEAAIRIASGFIVMLLCLIFGIRSLRGVLVPFFATVGGIGSVLGYSAFFGFTADESLISLPILLGMALSVGYAIHYINAFKLQFRKCCNRKQSVIQSVRETGWPILFTVITTIASFISFLFADIPPLRWLGGISACIVLAVFVYVIILIPVLYSFGSNTVSQKNSAALEKTDGRFMKYGAFISDKRRTVIVVSTVIMALCIPGLFFIHVNMDYIQMMGKRIPYIKEMMTILDAKLGNEYSYNVMIEYDNPNEFKKAENMKKIDELSDRLATLRMTRFSGTKPRITSVTEIVKEMNRTLNSDESSFYRIPDGDDEVTQLMFLYEISGGDSLSSWLTEDYSSTYIHVDLKGYNAKDISSDLANARTYAAELFPEAHTCVEGDVTAYAVMNGKLVYGELKSFLGSFIIIAVLLMLAFGSVKMGLIAMIPNVAPVLLIGAYMGYLNVPLDMLTMTIMPMILGIAVDDTIHLTCRVKEELEKGIPRRDAIALSFSEIGKSMFQTTFILCSMFLMFMFSPMNMLFNIGVLSIIGLAGALIADYTLTPALIYVSGEFITQGE